MPDRPAPDPAKLLAQWMEWETGEVTPGRVMANLKTGGLRDLLESLVAVQAEQVSAAASEIEEPAVDPEMTASWTPIV